MFKDIRWDELGLFLLINALALFGVFTGVAFIVYILMG